MKKSKNNRIRINCSFSRYERTSFNTLKKRAQKEGYKTTPYLKKAALAYISEKSILPQRIESKLNRLISLTGGMANNLNQIVRHSNKVKSATIFDLMKARMIVFNLEEAVEEFFKKDSL